MLSRTTCSKSVPHSQPGCRASLKKSMLESFPRSHALRQFAAQFSKRLCGLGKTHSRAGSIRWHGRPPIAWCFKPYVNVSGDESVSSFPEEHHCRRKSQSFLRRSVCPFLKGTD